MCFVKNKREILSCWYLFIFFFYQCYLFSLPFNEGFALLKNKPQLSTSPKLNLSGNRIKFLDFVK